MGVSGANNPVMKPTPHAKGRAKSTALRHVAAMAGANSSDLRHVAAVAGSSEPLLLTSEAQKILWANQSAARLFEVRGAQLIGLSFKDLVTLPPEAVDEACRAVTLRGYVRGGIDIVTATRKTLPVQFRAFALGDGTLHLVALRPDPAGRTPFRDRLPPGATPLPVSAEVTAAVGHEIRTPLATALLYMGIVQQSIDAGLQTGPAKTALAAAQQEISRIDRLVTRVTEMQRLGCPVMRPQLVDLRHVVSEAVQRTALGHQAHLVHLVSGRGNLVDWWDDTAVEQIVGNLLSNAVKFGEGRPIEVTVGRAEERAIISVRDQGIGIPVADQAGIFDRLPSNPLARLPGMGLGLWFVRALSEAHGGYVTVRSRAAAGATFTVTLRPFSLDAGP
jgi:signal transduction histidine kinase